MNNTKTIKAKRANGEGCIYQRDNMWVASFQIKIGENKKRKVVYEKQRQK